MTQENPTYYLCVDVRSSSKSDVLYGKQGERVTILGDHGNVMTVEGECGTFPVKKELLSLGPIDPASEPEEYIQNKIPSKKQPSKKPVTITSKLF